MDDLGRPPFMEIPKLPWQLFCDLRLELRQQREKLQQQLCNLLQQFSEMRGEQEILCLGRAAARPFILIDDVGETW